MSNDENLLAIKGRVAMRRWARTVQPLSPVQFEGSLEYTLARIKRIAAESMAQPDYWRLYLRARAHILLTRTR